MDHTDLLANEQQNVPVCFICMPCLRVVIAIARRISDSASHTNAASIISKSGRQA